MCFLTGYRPTSIRESGSGIEVVGTASIGSVAGGETSGTDEVSTAGVVGTGTSEVDEGSTIGVSGSEAAGVDVVSTVGVAGVEVSGSGAVSTVDGAGVEVSGGTVACLDRLTWANWTCLTWVDNESKEPVNICGIESQGTV